MPPSAAPEWLRTGWIFEITATSAPRSNASMAARIPAQPAPMTSTSCLASTGYDATRTGAASASLYESLQMELEAPSELDHDEGTAKIALKPAPPGVDSAHRSAGREHRDFGQATPM